MLWKFDLDIFTKAKRSSVMAAIRHRGNRSTEGTFAGLLRCHRISGWKLHQSTVTGKPDFYFPKRRIAVFVDGCFWHGCPKCFQAPRQNAAFWAEKIERNRKRDRKVARALRREGVEVIRIWEHDLENRTRRVSRVIELLGRKKVG
ncbi:MAG: very short patch repair endonuclease [Terracidiphilus sp.]